MTERHARLGFLVPPGNPTVEPEVFSMAPPGVSVHFSRMIMRGTPGMADGMAERVQTTLDNIDEPVQLLALVRPKVIVMALTASSYLLGREGEAALTQRLEKRTGIPFTSAFVSVVTALNALGVRKVALGTPYGEAITLQCKSALETYEFEVVNQGRLGGTNNIYDESPERAYSLACAVDTPTAEAIFLPGTGFPTIAVLDRLERELGKPVISSTAAMMWNALRIAGIAPVVPGYGRLLAAARHESLGSADQL